MLGDMLNPRTFQHGCVAGFAGSADYDEQLVGLKLTADGCVGSHGLDESC